MSYHQSSGKMVVFSNRLEKPLSKYKVNSELKLAIATTRNNIWLIQLVFKSNPNSIANRSWCRFLKHCPPWRKRLGFVWSLRKVWGPSVSVVASVDTIYPKMTVTATATYLELATRQREGFKEKLAQLQMNKAQNSRFMTQETQWKTNADNWQLGQ